MFLKAARLSENIQYFLHRSSIIQCVISIANVMGAFSSAGHVVAGADLKARLKVCSWHDCFVPCPNMIAPLESAFTSGTLFPRAQARLRLYTVRCNRWWCALSWFANHQKKKAEETPVYVRYSSVHLCTGAEHIHELELYLSPWRHQ